MQFHRHVLFTEDTGADGVVHIVVNVGNLIRPTDNASLGGGRLLAAGVVLLALFVWIETRVRNPLLPLHVVTDRVRAGAFLILNPDARITAAHVRRLRGRVDAEPATLVSPVVRKPSGEPWFTGADLYLDTGQVASSRHRGDYPGRRHTQWLSGACLMIHARLWDRLGGFDEEYFLYWEDVDLSWRAAAAGAELLVDAGAVAVHAVGGTQPSERHNRGGRGKSTLYYRYNIRNRLLFAARNLADEDLRRWMRSTYPQAWAVLMRGGRRQLLHPAAPLRAVFLGLREGRRIARAALREGRGAGHPAARRGGVRRGIRIRPGSLGRPGGPR